VTHLHTAVSIQTIRLRKRFVDPKGYPLPS
jgi:hypothetical protein